MTACARCGEVKPRSGFGYRRKICAPCVISLPEPRGTRGTLAERFWRKVRRSDGCWEWTAYLRPDGYGTIGAGGKYGGMIRAHVASWRLHFGPVPAGLCVLHRCDNRGCVRPDHLWLGTRADNMRDMDQKGRRVTSDRRGERQWWRAKLTDAAVVLIRTSPLPTQRVARILGVSAGLIYKVRSRQTWTHL